MGRGSSRAHKPWSELRPGDYDGAVLDLTAIAVGQARNRQRLDIVLTTNDTCYRATEDAELFGCKRLTKQWWDIRGTTFAVSPFGVVKTPESRLTIVSTFVVTVTSDNYMVLTRRSANVIHAKSVVSATAGGIVEVTSGGHLREDGFASVWDAIKRETKEELGLSLERGTTNPIAVWLSNSTEKQPDSERHGQVVAVVHWYSRIPQSRGQVVEAAKKAHPATGSFEVEDLVFVSLDRGPHEFINEVNRKIPEMDQHGYVSSVFTALQWADAWGLASTGSRARDALLDLLETDLTPWGHHDGRRFLDDPDDFLV